jgi:peptidoglycan hydrolase-like protein with peptidoglycan-binding domain
MFGKLAGGRTRRLATAVGVLALAPSLAIVFSSGAASAAPKQAGKVPIVTAASTYSQCNHVNDGDRPTKRQGAGLPNGNDAYVRQIQCLINVGSKYPIWLTVDGQFGPKTNTAVRWVQDCNDTSGGVDGIVGQWTWLDLYLPDSQCAL